MDAKISNFQGSQWIVTLSPKVASQIVRPKIYLLRHAESQAKEYIPEAKAHKSDLSIVDPKLSECGRKQCLEVSKFFESQGIHITHILSAPLSRTLETACWTFGDIIRNGVKVLAVPELQSIGILPNGTGMSLDELMELYGDDSQRLGLILGLNPSNSLDLKAELVSGSPIQGVQGAKGEVEKYSFGARDFRGFVDFRFMCEDWNDPVQKAREFGGRYSTIEKRYRPLRGFLSGLRAGMKDGDPLNIVMVSHSSILRGWVADPEWDTFEVLIWRFDFNREGNLRKRAPGSRIIQVPVGETIEQQSHSKREPAVMNPVPVPGQKPEVEQKKVDFLEGQTIEVPDSGVSRTAIAPFLAVASGEQNI